MPCRTQLESRLKAMDVRGLFDHLVACSSRALWSSDTLVVSFSAPALQSLCITTHLYSASPQSLCQGLGQNWQRVSQLLIWTPLCLQVGSIWHSPARASSTVPHLRAPCACVEAKSLLRSCNGTMRRPWCATARLCMCCRLPAAGASYPSCTACLRWRCTPLLLTGSCSQGRILLWSTTESWHVARVSEHSPPSGPTCSLSHLANSLSSSCMPSLLHPVLR